MKRIDISNQQFGRTTAKEALPNSKWKCLCDCGTEHVTTYGRLTSGQTQSCGCKRRDKMHAYRSQFKPLDLTGQRFERLTVLRVDAHEKRKHVRWLCVCDCGSEKTIASHNLTGGSVKSCGCLKAESRFTHGLTGTPEWKLHANSKKRAKEMGIENTLKIEDIVIPDVCPLLGIPLVAGTKIHHDQSPSIDRINSQCGYTKENIWVISMRANKIKNAASFSEFMSIAQNWWHELDRRLAQSAPSADK